MRTRGEAEAADGDAMGVAMVAWTDVPTLRMEGSTIDGGGDGGDVSWMHVHLAVQTPSNLQHGVISTIAYMGNLDNLLSKKL